MSGAVQAADRDSPSPPDRGLSRRHRLVLSADFRDAFNQGRGLAGRYMVMYPRRGEGASLRLGVVTSRRTFRRAVDRSRARRLLREAFRLNRCGLAPEADVVLVGRRALLGASLREVEKDLLRLAGKARLVGAQDKREAQAPCRSCNDS
jgi:ribonuclease P protein component